MGRQRRTEEVPKKRALPSPLREAIRSIYLYHGTVSPPLDRRVQDGLLARGLITPDPRVRNDEHPVTGRRRVIGEYTLTRRGHNIACSALPR